MKYLHTNGIRMHLKGYQGAEGTIITIFSKIGILLNEDARDILAAAKTSYIYELIKLTSTQNPIWVPSIWIPLV